MPRRRPASRPPPAAPAHPTDRSGRAFPSLGTAKAAGALGLLAGLSVPPLGVAAAVGLVLSFVGAAVSHLRVKDYAVAPAVVLTLLSAAALVLRVTA